MFFLDELTSGHRSPVPTSVSSSRGNKKPKTFMNTGRPSSFPDPENPFRPASLVISPAISAKSQMIAPAPRHWAENPPPYRRSKTARNLLLKWSNLPKNRRFYS
jgi:hypothetical protein